MAGCFQYAVLTLSIHSQQKIKELHYLDTSDALYHVQHLCSLAGKLHQHMQNRAVWLSGRDSGCTGIGPKSLKASPVERKSNMHQIKSELNCDSSLHCEGRSQMIVIQ